MTALVRTTLVELRLFLRDPAAAFFTLLLPLLLVLLNASAAGEPEARWLLPGMACLVLATAGFMWLPGTVATYREQGVLHRQRATPLHPATILAAHVALNVALVMAGLALVVGVGVALGFEGPRQPLGVLVAALVASLSVCATGFALASAVRTARGTQAVAAAVYFPMIFLSGAAARRDQLPDPAGDVAAALPLTYAVDAVGAPWRGAGVDAGALAVLGAIAVVAAAVAVRTFRWR